MYFSDPNKQWMYSQKACESFKGHNCNPKQYLFANIRYDVYVDFYIPKSAANMRIPSTTIAAEICTRFGDIIALSVRPLVFHTIYYFQLILSI